LPDGALTEADASYGKAAIVGVAQGIATFPGISRSGTTITACLACGFKREFAVKYSFIMSIPAILGALVLELLDFAPEMLSGTDIVNYLAGTFVSAEVGYVCIKTMLVVVRGKKFKYFAYYCFAMGAFAVLFSILA
ncbi:MAG: undecaprenyl-diphosphate phosphatase, partial [Lachnospiraceae bacterium]|nr:undecaprenyl-diphosphate phosphatase [Lachnospiraceae bacterium]